MQQLTETPAIKWLMAHPRFSAWVVLAAGMVALLVNEARNVGLLPTQWVALIIATILVAGACIWIISWEDKDDPEEAAQADAATGETQDLNELLNTAAEQRAEQLKQR
ncbi:MAG: hypothetical protein OXG92_11965 [Chloroflexi bacterium]|nr:hypothetical protein [Chloroflexota bacterium]MCY3581662.1 hypothetical protein [Chloroflexota bacterium]MCY3717172.1 hypothetical protein [Chloroflexota bacterium]MDE2650389.1 hypothetical protein [Chloroflexota bacterium]MXV92270.1 hypothetical protein [Chloroflexota bacterium]